LPAREVEGRGGSPKSKGGVNTNELKVRLAGGEKGFGAWCVMPSAFGAELLAGEGFDYVCIDCQHGLVDFDEMWPMVQCLRWSRATPLVRIQSAETTAAGKALDAGAEGVIFPMVNSRGEAENAVAACRYPPEGVRSFGPVRSGLLLGMDPAAVNREILCLAMVETIQGVELADEICATKGLDGVYLGPADLAVSMGMAPATMHKSRDHADAIEHVRKVCEAHGIASGIHTVSGEQARKYAEAGFQMCSIATDAVLLRTLARRELAAARGEPFESEKSPYS
jgi:4-hydroxy-2-oxoheptanedioate aldolase